VLREIAIMKQLQHENVMTMCALVPCFARPCRATGRTARQSWAHRRNAQQCRAAVELAAALLLLRDAAPLLAPVLHRSDRPPRGPSGAGTTSSTTRARTSSIW
jgi:hypothetical protein